MKNSYGRMNMDFPMAQPPYGRTDAYGLADDPSFYLVKNVHFWAILTKTNICTNHQHIWTKIGLKTILIWIWEDFWSYVLFNGAYTGFGQICPKMDIFYKVKSKKSLTTKIFPKIQNAQNIWFSHRFSISSRKTLPRDLQTLRIHPLTLEWPRLTSRWSKFWFLWPRWFILVGSNPWLYLILEFQKFVFFRPTLIYRG